ncbi:MAG: exosortase/archaeosortase family protein [bacterium]|nr:exosortase/archaeosortase family protein [bacterium]
MTKLTSASLGFGFLLAFTYFGAISNGLTPAIALEDEFLFSPSPSLPGLNIALAICFLLLRRQRIIGAISSELAFPGLGGPLLASGMALHGWAHYTGAADLDVVSLMLVFAGIALLFGGIQLLCATGPALPLLALVLPPPAAAMNGLIPLLQVLARDLAAGMSTALGSAATTSGDFIQTNDHLFRVVETCSGVRALWTLQLAAITYGELWPCNLRRRLVLCAAAIPIALLINAIRIVVIMMMADSRFAEDHALQGITAIIAGVLALHTVNLLIEQWRGPAALASSRETIDTRSRNEGEDSTRIRLAFQVALASLIALASFSYVLPAWTPPPYPATWSVLLLRKIEGYTTRKRPVDDAELGSIGYKKIIRRRYEEQGEDQEAAIQILIAFHDRIERRTSLWSPRWERPGPEFDVVERTIRRTELLPFPIVVTTSKSPEAETLTWSWFEGTTGPREEILRSLAAVDRSPLRSPIGIVAVRISTAIPSRPEGRLLAQRRLERFVLLTREGIVAAEIPTSSASTRNHLDGHDDPDRARPAPR